MKAKRFKHGTYREYVVKRKARKDHICSECGRLIEKGEEYYYDNFASKGILMMTGERLGGGTWTYKKICENCWRGTKLVA